MPRHIRAKGQALVEFALSATLIFFLLAATVDLGLIFFTLQALHNAAQEGATYGSRFLDNGALDVAGIRDRARHEAGNQGIGFANLLDLNSNGVDDASEPAVLNSYIQINMWQDVDGNGDPIPDNTPCASASTSFCYLQVVVSADYNFLFPLAPAFGDQRKLTSTYIIPMRSGFQQGGP
jgi:hypothetical protein